MSLLYAKCVHDLFQRASEAQSIYAFRSKPTLKPMQALCRRMKDPQSHFKCIHIAGTNGKGSTSTKLAASLSLCGYRVGLFTSPHISSVRERIRVNGQMISKPDFVADCTKIMGYEQEIAHKLSFFELMNAIAFYHFKRIGVDFAVIEVGVGGTWDSTNVIEEPLLSVIVSVSLDHTQILGDTVEQIAADKCGIIKKGRPTVIGLTVPSEVAEARAEAMRSALYQLRAAEMGPFETYDDHNSCLARFALEVLSREYFILPKSVGSLSKALLVRPPCRMESVRVDLAKLVRALCLRPKTPKSPRSPRTARRPLLASAQRHWLRRFVEEPEYLRFKEAALRPLECLLDVAHNPAAFEQFFRSLTRRFPPSRFSYRVVLAMNPRKQFVDCCRAVTEHADRVHLVSAAQSMDTGQLRAVLTEQCGFGEHRISDRAKGDIFREIMFALHEAAEHNHAVLSDYESSSASVQSADDDDGDGDIGGDGGGNDGDGQRPLGPQRKECAAHKSKTQVVVICGSFYIMNDARKSLGLRHDDDEDDLRRYHPDKENEDEENSGKFINL